MKTSINLRLAANLLRVCRNDRWWQIVENRRELSTSANSSQTVELTTAKRAINSVENSHNEKFEMCWSLNYYLLSLFSILFPPYKSHSSRGFQFNHRELNTQKHKVEFQSITHNADDAESWYIPEIIRKFMVRHDEGCDHLCPSGFGVKFNPILEFLYVIYALCDAISDSNFGSSALMIALVQVWN